MNRSVAGRIAQQIVQLQDRDLVEARLAANAAQARATGPGASGASDPRSDSRASLLSAIPEPWRSHYERLRARYGRAVVPVRELTCLGCYTRVPAGIVPRTRDAPVLTRCECCGRLLLWPSHLPDRPDRTP